MINPELLSKLTLDSNGQILIEGKKINDNQTYYNVAGLGGVIQYTFGYISNANTIMTASSNNITHCGKVVGIILENKNEGEKVEIITGGEVVNPNWSLISGNSYYIGLGGDATNIAPTIGFVQKIGIAKNSNTLVIRLEQPIKLM